MFIAAGSAHTELIENVLCTVEVKVEQLLNHLHIDVLQILEPIEDAYKMGACSAVGFEFALQVSLEQIHIGDLFLSV